MRLAASVLFLTCATWAQVPTAPPVELPQTEPPKTEPQAPPVLRNTGKPMLVPFQCTDDDMEWAGMSCTEEDPCPVYLEVSAVETIGNRIIALANIHSEATTLYSLLMASEDAGATWHEVYERMRGTGLDHIQFIDFQYGWISGETLVPVSRDPFLLLTSDGGKTWHSVSVFNEGGGGAIQQFWFTSPSSGALVIDRMESTESSRYELYETPNGGETWMIRRTSDQPISIKRTGAAPGSTWRIRADARTKSFVIEKQQGERWSTVASFLVEMGACKPAPRAAPAPPQETDQAEQPHPLTPPPARPPSLKRPPPKQ
jgi:hypothetical protein